MSDSIKASEVLVGGRMWVSALCVSMLIGCASGSGSSMPTASQPEELTAALSTATDLTAEEKAIVGTPGWMERLARLSKTRLQELAALVARASSRPASTTATTTSGAPAAPSSASTVAGPVGQVIAPSTSPAPLPAPIPITSTGVTYPVGGVLPNTPIPNQIRISQNTSGTLLNHPYAFGRVFVQGEVMRCPAVDIDGTALPFQATVKNRYPDGSVKFAVFHAVVPTLAPNNQRSLRFFDAACPAAPAPKSAAQLLASTPNYETQLRFSNGVNATVNASAMLASGRFEIWSDGPVATTVVVADHTTKQFDVGADSHRSLRPIFHITFWHTINATSTRVIVEQSDTMKLQDQQYDVAVATGKAAPSIVYSRAGVPHRYATRWTKVFWQGISEPLMLSQDHSIAYLARSRALPNFDSRVRVSQSSVTSFLARWTGASKDIFDNGLYERRMPNVGGRGEIGLLSDWIVLALFSGNGQIWDAVQRNADLGGAWSMHFREGDANRSFSKRPFLVSGLGLPMTKDGRRGVFLHDGNGYMTSQQNNKPEDILTPVGTLQTSQWTPDGSHQPDDNYPMYLVTGDWWYLEQLQFWASWGLFSVNPAYAPDTWQGGGARDGLSDGNISNEARGEAWIFRTRVRAAAFSPDGSPQKSYFTRVNEGAVSVWLGAKVSADSADPIRTNWRGYFQRYFPEELKPNPLHYWSIGTNRNSIPVADAADNVAPWQFGFMMLALGHAQELGFNVAELKDWFSQWFVGLATDPAVDPRHLANYVFPSTKNIPGKPYFQSFLDAVNDWQGWTPAWSHFAADYTHGYTNILTAAMSYTTNVPNGDAAWAWAYSTNYVTRDWSLNPKFAILPR